MKRRPVPEYWQDRGPSDTEERPVPPPVFQSWTDYLARTTEKERMAWCADKANRSNRRDRLPYFPTIPWLSNKRGNQERQDIEWFQEKLSSLLGELPRTPENIRLVVGHIRWEEQERAKKLAALPSKFKITKHHVWAVMSAAQGRCAYCGSLAVEYAPTKTHIGGLDEWAQIGRRIGSVDHVASRENHPDNLAWCCYWCNTWPQERRPLAADHGGFYPG